MDDGVGLVAICDDMRVAQYADGIVHGQRINVMGFIYGVGFYRVTFAHKYAVAAAGTTAHDPVDLNHTGAIGRLSYYNATTGIGGGF